VAENTGHIKSSGGKVICVLALSSPLGSEVTTGEGGEIHEGTGKLGGGLVDGEMREKDREVHKA